MAPHTRFYEAETSGDLRSAPAALRNREAIADVLAGWLPPKGLILEVASGTGEHSIHFAERFPSLEWQPSDVDPVALRSIEAWRKQSDLLNIRAPLVLDAAAAEWPIERVDALVNINMVHISPWSSALGLIDGARRLLATGAPLILYGPWIRSERPIAPTNIQFDSELKRRDPRWGLRTIEDFAAAAQQRDLHLEDVREMPANNMMVLLRRS